ncbi:UDP-N-acetylmuramoyl-tripeptide--D-alanyl-D-alanine ligase [Luteimonas sp. RIT-PG2_3]
MNPLPLSRIAQWTNGNLCRCGLAGDVLIDAVATDTRTLDASDGRAALFVALKGENFDGNDHVAAAAEQGARAALVAREIDIDLPQIVVADTERALASFAAAMQHGRSGKVIGITGSNGKTTVKQLLESILSRVGPTYVNPGNRNNEIGLPLAVIDAPDAARFAVYEMGAGKFGDIAYLTAVVRPVVSLVNNIAAAHLERMQSLLGIADTKAAIYDALPLEGIAVINADDAFAPYFEQRVSGRRIIRYGIEASADVTARAIRQDEGAMHFVLVTPQGEIDVALPLQGRHNVCNALAAASLALAVDAPLADIRAGLNASAPVKGRLVRHRLGNGATLIDDSYNANPGSLAAAIDTLAAVSGRNWIALGDMRELGDDAVALHVEAGRHARAAGIERLLTLGPLSAAAADAFGPGALHFETHDDLIDFLRVELHSGIRVLVKGSRGSAMDRIVNALLPTGDIDAA